MIAGKSRTYIDFNMENNKSNAKFEASDHEKISKYEMFY